MIAFPNKKDGGTGQGMRIAAALGIPLVVCRRGQASTDHADVIRQLTVYL